MSLREYKCRLCGETAYVFDGEFCEEYGGLNCEGPFPHLWKKMPPKFTIVLATSLFMTEEAQLDSLPTVYELDRVLSIEARAAKETELFQDIRRNL